MFKKVLASIIAATMISCAAYAGPAPRTVEGYFQEVSKATGKPIEQVREEGVEALRRAGEERYSNADLERIRRGEPVEFDSVRRNEAISLIKNDTTFKARTGLASVRNDSIARSGGDAFDAMRDNRSADRTATVDRASERKQPTQDQVDITELRKLEGIRTKISLEAVEALKAIDHPASYIRARRVAEKLADRVAKGDISKDSATRLIVDVVNSRKPLNGKLPLGKGAEGACIGMEAKAIENLADFIHGGVTEGKDDATYVQGMAKVAAEKFHQDLVTSLKRLKALAEDDEQSGCGILSKGIGEVAGKLIAAQPAAI